MNATPENTFKQAIRRRRPQIGLRPGLSSPHSAEICAGAGFDWLVVDSEHGPQSLPLVSAQLQAIDAAGGHAVVRVPSDDRIALKRYVDLGARTALVPMVETAEQAAGVDGVFVGPADLAASPGHLGEPDHPVVVAAVTDALRRITAASRPAGVLTRSESLAADYLRAGAVFVAVSVDTLLLARRTEELAARFAAVALPPDGTRDSLRRDGRAVSVTSMTAGGEDPDTQFVPSPRRTRR